MLARTTARVAAYAAALCLLLGACTSEQPDDPFIVGGSFSGEESEAPSSQPAKECPAAPGSPVAVYGVPLTAVAFMRPDGTGLFGKDARESAPGREIVTRRGSQLRLAPTPQDVASAGRALVVLYDSGRVFAIDSATCRASEPHDLTTAELGLPDESDVLFLGLARSGGPTPRTVVYGSYSPPGQKLYEGFAAELDRELNVTRYARYDPQVVQDVWVDTLGDPLVLLDDGTVQELGASRPVVAPAYEHAEAATNVSRGTSGIWVVGGERGANFLRLPTGRVLELPKDSYATPVTARGREAVVLLGKRSEAWFVTDAGLHVAVPLGAFPIDVVTVGESALVIGKNANRAWVIKWATRKVVSAFAAGPEPARLIPLG